MSVEDIKEDIKTLIQPADVLPIAKHPRSRVSEKLGSTGPTLGQIQTALDVLGFVPVIGTSADLLNAAIYLASQDYANASLSAVGSIPGYGDAVVATAKTAGALPLIVKFGKPNYIDNILTSYGITLEPVIRTDLGRF